MALYEQGVQKIEVIVKKEGGLSTIRGANETKNDDISSDSSSGGSEEKSSAFSSNDLSKRSRVIKTNTTHTLAVARQVGLLAINYYVGGIGYSSGDQALQDNIQRQIEIVGDISGFLSATSMGALYGSWGGTIGTVVGATLGAIQSSTSTMFKYLGRNRKYNFDIFKEENTIEYNRYRANINLTNGRLR